MPTVPCSGTKKMPAQYQPYQYVGKLATIHICQEPDFGLVQLGVRFYDAQTGRFTQRDRLPNVGSGFVYSGNRPVAATDPSGLSTIGPTPSDPPDQIGPAPGMSECDKKQCRNWCKNRLREQIKKANDSFKKCLSAVAGACSSVPWPADTACAKVGFQACSAAYAGWMAGTWLAYTNCLLGCM